LFVSETGRKRNATSQRLRQPEWWMGGRRL